MREYPQAPRGRTALRLRARARHGLLPLAMLSLITGCHPNEPDDYVPVGDASYALMPSTGTTTFTVDSVIYDPVVGGTARRELRRTWRVSVLDARSDGITYEVAVRDSSGALGALLWDWQIIDHAAVNTLDGRSYLGLTWPLRAGVDWDPLAYGDPALVLSVAGEPIEIHKGWRAALDSVGDYTLPDGRVVAAAWITLADSENLLELREAREVYGQGEGLLERHLRILDTQQTASTAPWTEKAERGFAVDIVRSQ